MRGRRVQMVPALAALIAGVAACGGGVDDGGVAAPTTDGAPTVATGGWIGEGGDVEWSFGEGTAAGASGSDAAYERAADLDSPASTLTEGESGVVAPEPGPGPDLAPVDSRLNAGSVDDNERWEDYLLYREEFAATGVDVHEVDIRGRQVVHVVDDDGAPVLGATVEVVDGSGSVVARRTTYADGRIMFFAEPTTGQGVAPEYRVEVSKGDATAEAVLDTEASDHTVTLEAPAAADPVPLDVLFLIDATGSMEDEIDQLKANMISVAEQIDGLAPRPDVHFAMTVYRDRGDLFVTRTFDFTSNVTEFTDALRDVVAGGGGDTPESLNEALHAALDEPTWRGADTVKLVFLVADAAPHLDYADDADYAADVQVAAERGVKIHPVASSGLDAQGEYVFRQLAQLTTGRFNFLTYGADGRSPGDSTPYHVDDYSVLSLDDLVVQLVRDELAPLAPPAG